jgi:aspartate aminotransferase
MRKLSDLSTRLQGQGMFKILERANELEAQGREILHFELGDPDFNTPKGIVNACIDALRKGETHYAGSAGLLELRTAAANSTMRGSRKFKPDLDQLLVTHGANPQIYYALSCTVNPGEEVVVPDPGFVSYFSILSQIGIQANRVQLHEKNGFRLNPGDVRKAITKNTRAIIINSPSNPTGAVMTEQEVKGIYEIAKEHDLWLLSDEVYKRMIHDKPEGGKVFTSPSEYDHCKERTIIINGFSKSHAMTGWRMGIATGPSEVIDKMRLQLETEQSCVPPFLQRACIEALEGGQKETYEMADEYKRRRDKIVRGLNQLDGISCLTPAGAFYAFPNVSGTGMTSDEFAGFMLDKAGVALTPGPIFGNYGEGYVRFSYVNSLERIENALERMDFALSQR